MHVTMTRGKFEWLDACANEQGVIAALAVDHRDNLLEAIAQARGTQGQATAEDMYVFKTAVTGALTPYASAILLDPVYGLEAIASRAPHTGVMLAYELSSYGGSGPDRLPDILPQWSVRRLVEAGAQAIKILLYYNPFDSAEVNAIKQAYVERIGAECIALDVPLFLEPLVYDNTLGDIQGLAFAHKKPEYVALAMEEFSKPRYSVDMLKVELPINPKFVAGASANVEVAYSRQEAITHFRNAASATSKPFIYLSAGVSNETFCDMLALAAEAGVKYSGVLCGRATWQDAIAIYATQGTDALHRWLAEMGKRNIESINAVVARGAVAWWDVYGGKEQIGIEG